MASPFAFFGLIFPILIFFTSLFFVYQGVIRFSAKFFSGIVKSKTLITDPYGVQCVYYKTDIESYCGGHQPWKRIYSDEKRSSFYVENQEVDLNSADIRLTPTKIVNGHIKRAGLIQKAIETVSTNLIGKISFLSSKDSKTSDLSKLPVDEENSKLLEGLLKSKKIPVQYMTKPFRITQYTLTPGESIYLSYIGSDGKLLHPFLLTNFDESTTKTICKEKSYLTIFIGVLLLLLSFAAYYVILDSIFQPL
ncbi:Uncharacterised protein [Candidatus Bilamarchaeum dharawalense]|uniref:Uncharacterized protein n=1 Tax=Candidatus Bilamarchaeum dharawalense TaxID=2885759 RepID=A0A5E4LR54_9ARCH|nr:Uncharacterised protein [Candidatus Bilamarchaeum dharawalense]